MVCVMAVGSRCLVRNFAVGACAGYVSKRGNQAGPTNIHHGSWRSKFEVVLIRRFLKFEIRTEWKKYLLSFETNVRLRYLSHYCEVTRVPTYLGNNKIMITSTLKITNLNANYMPKLPVSSLES